MGLLALCLQPGAPYAQPLTHDAWWQAIAAGCRGDLAGEQRAFAAALAQGIRRIDVMRAVLPQATSLARLAVQRFPGSPNAQFWLGENLAAAGDTSGAIQAYQQALQLRPSAGTQWRILGDLYQKQGDWQKAAQAYDQACLWVDSGHNGCYKAGLLYYQHQLYNLAIQRLQRTVGQERYWAPGYKALANALIDAGRAQDARPYLEYLAKNGDSQAQKTLQELQANQP